MGQKINLKKFVNELPKNVAFALVNIALHRVGIKFIINNGVIDAQNIDEEKCESYRAWLQEKNDYLLEKGVKALEKFSSAEKI